MKFKIPKRLINSGFIELSDIVSKLKTKVKENIVNEDLEEKDNYFLLIFVIS